VTGYCSDYSPLAVRLGRPLCANISKITGVLQSDLWSDSLALVDCH
jgi:hypothetical protein